MHMAPVFASHQAVVPAFAGWNADYPVSIRNGKH